MIRVLLVICCLSVISVQAAVQPELSVSVNSTTHAQIQQGWPLLVSITLRNPDAHEELLLSPKGIAWPHTVKVSLVSKDGKVVSESFSLPVESPTPSVKLPAGASTHFFYVMDDAATARIAPGQYLIKTDLQIEQGKGWVGKVQKNARLTVIVKSGSDQKMHQAAVLLSARSRLLYKDTTGAINILQAYLKQEPDAVPVLRLLAEIFTQEGHVDQALLHIEHALELYRQHPTQKSLRPELPVALLTLRRHLRHSILFGQNH